MSSRSYAFPTPTEGDASGCCTVVVELLIEPAAREAGTAQAGPEVGVLAAEIPQQPGAKALDHEHDQSLVEAEIALRDPVSDSRGSGRRVEAAGENVLADAGCRARIKGAHHR